MVRDGQKLRLASYQWTVSVTDEGVSMLSKTNRVLLVFDRSLAAPVSSGSSGSSPESNAPATAPEAPASTPVAAP
jgi:hypothetical protein